ncbi:peptidase C15 [Bosea sp. 124]|uniref:pyroglutamyl-peptidase I family protein n=1 Tax=Bosea sp. 124 TaxID=2135642 RepID=UPI000D44394E|nr:peptidase C15 [Bosea sp. 124]PTM38767.1 pyroglutamyl-peptidase [Bosea sp. 124]
MDILVTGFGPFPRVRVNPTTGLARAVAARLKRSGLAAQALVVETSYGTGLPALRAHLAQQRPKAILMLGLAARSRFVRVELFGRGHASPLHADATGGTPKAGAARPTTLPARTTASAQGALAALRRRGIRSRLSPSAGRYLCDACYAAALAETRGTATPVLFVHVPWLRPAPGLRPKARVAAFRPSAATLAGSLAAIGAALARQGR